jgi:DNA-directed RNA polymerase subunit RPC12/RpoP
MAAILRFAPVGDSGRQHDPTGQWAHCSPTNEPIPFMSRCPRCGHRRLQDGYVRRVLRRLLSTNGKILAYCIPCDQFWPISPLERSGIVIGLGD